MLTNRLPANQRSRNARLVGPHRTVAEPLPIETGRE
jgi:hypothetical protein